MAALASLFEKDGRRQHRIAQRWAHASVLASGAKVTVLYPERLRAQAAVYVCNHLSYMDTPVIFSSLPFQFRIVARHDLFDLPFIGWYLRRSGQVPVDVGNPRASIASLVSAVRTLQGGMPLFIFPEGGRSESGHLGKFLNGPAFMAIRAQLPLVPMALIGTHELLPIHTSEVHPGPVTLVVGEPIETKGMTMKQVDDLTAQLEQEIARMYYEHSWRKRPESEAPENLHGAGGLKSATIVQDLSTVMTEEAPKR
ncbi:MAG TPA: lysophospholipid acyltransferase family protein [Acidobacteriaceae bacterium]|nr:lysophospholipid acyltransferase family protein [Acidobacteriaceae bacterium]